MGEMAVEIFWWAAEQLRYVTQLASPFLLLGTALAWVVKHRTAESYLAVLGSILFAGSELVHHLVPEVRGVVFHNHPPAEDQNGVVYFFYVHAWWLGIGIFGSATFLHFVRKQKIRVE